jgi:hypothetical protein
MRLLELKTPEQLEARLKPAHEPQNEIKLRRQKQRTRRTATVKNRKDPNPNAINPSERLFQRSLYIWVKKVDGLNG